MAVYKMENPHFFEDYANLTEGGIHDEWEPQIKN